MDGKSFDTLARGLAAVATRRRTVGALLGVIAGAGLTGADAAEPRRSYCRKVDAICTRNSQCCSGACDTSRVNHRTRRNRCVCVPNCDDRECGGDGCGGYCGENNGACYWEYETCNSGACENVCSDYTDRFCYERLDGTTVLSPVDCKEYYNWDDPDPCYTDAECQETALPFIKGLGYQIICARRQFQEGSFAQGMTLEEYPGGVCFAFPAGDGACF